MNDELKALQAEVLDRLRNACGQLELDKAIAIAEFFQWLAEQESKHAAP